MSSRDLDHTDSPLRLRSGRGLAVAVAGVLGLGLLVVPAAGVLSPWVAFWCIAIAVALVDLHVLDAVARRSARRTAVRCGIVGLAALVVQAVGVYATVAALYATDDQTSGWFFWTCPVVAVLLAAALLARRPTRLYGWAVLIGSAEGFATFVLFIIAAFAACDCWD
jgi:hypothetical protein